MLITVGCLVVAGFSLLLAFCWYVAQFLPEDA